MGTDMAIRKMMMPAMILAMGLLVAVACAQDGSTLKSQMEKQSYALGVEVGNGLRHQPVEVDLDLFMHGVEDALSGSETLMTEKEVRAVVKDLRSQLKRKQAALRSEQRLKKKQEGEAFLAENKAKEGVVTLESGLQYEILKAGDGKKPTADDTVVAHYRGSLIDGTEFASSYARDRPATFAVKGVVEGWREALQRMPVGSKWRLFIPSHLAYGERGVRRLVAPNATLIVEVELLAIKDKADVGVKQARPGKRVAAAGIRVSFRVDPLLTRPHTGDRWVSPSTYTSVLKLGEVTVEAKAYGLDATGRLMGAINPTWVPADPDMVTVSPSHGHAVKITVKGAGESSLQVTSGKVSKTLTITAEYRGDAIQAKISQ